MGTRKILKIKEPIVYSYIPMGILFAIAGDNVMQWAVNELINIRVAQDWTMLVYEEHLTMLNNCPALFYYAFPQKYLVNDDPQALKELIIRLIDDDEYIDLHVDRRYIPATHEIDVFPHEILIYGYDLEKNQIYFADNIKRGRFATATCSFEEFEKAHWELKGKKFYYDEIKTIHPVETIQIGINTIQIAREITDYLESRNTMPVTDDQSYILGVAATVEVIRYLFELLDKDDMDIRPVHFIYERCLLMNIRINYLVEHGYMERVETFQQSYKEVEEDYLTIRNKMLKYILKRDKVGLASMIHAFEQTLQKEHELMREMVRLLS